MFIYKAFPQLNGIFFYVPLQPHPQSFLLFLHIEAYTVSRPNLSDKNPFLWLEIKGCSLHEVIHYLSIYGNYYH